MFIQNISDAQSTNQNDTGGPSSGWFWKIVKPMAASMFTTTSRRTRHGMIRAIRSR